MSAAGCTLVTCVSDVMTWSLTDGQCHLSHLDMSNCVRLGDCGLQQIVSCCRRLRCLYVRRCALITDGGLQSVATRCHSLTDISVSECRRVTDAGIVLLAVHLAQSLAHLSVAHCPLVGDRAFARLAERCCRLRYVNARGCDRVSDAGVMSLATSQRLRALDVSDCVGVGDTSLQALAHRCGAKLRRLSVRGCTSVSDHGVLAIALNCTRLRQLNVQDCPLVSTSALMAVREHSQNCVIEHNCLNF